MSVLSMVYITLYIRVYTVQCTVRYNGQQQCTDENATRRFRDCALIMADIPIDRLAPPVHLCSVWWVIIYSMTHIKRYRVSCIRVFFVWCSKTGKFSHIWKNVNKTIFHTLAFHSLSTNKTIMKTNRSQSELVSAALNCTDLYRTSQNGTTLNCNKLQGTVLNSQNVTELNYTEINWFALNCTELNFNALQCPSECYTALNYPGQYHNCWTIGAFVPS